MIESISEDPDETKSTHTLPELYAKLLRKIGSYTVYGSVCGVAVKALSRIKALEPPPRLAEDFKKFVTEVEERAKSKLKHDESAIAVCGRIGVRDPSPYFEAHADENLSSSVPTSTKTPVIVQKVIGFRHFVAPDVSKATIAPKNARNSMGLNEGIETCANSGNCRRREIRLTT
ncbi:hypothetical protein MPER_00529, partial [Moniliophthora perniciosa FA553]